MPYERCLYRDPLVPALAWLQHWAAPASSFWTVSPPFPVPLSALDSRLRSCTGPSFSFLLGTVARTPFRRANPIPILSPFSSLEHVQEVHHGRRSLHLVTR
jgi:hypothetical protein